MRFSAEDSLPVPASKPDPAIYRHACRELGVAPDAAIAVEDSAPGVASAAAAGVPTIGNLQFVPASERAERAHDLYACGAALIVSSWSELETTIASISWMHTSRGGTGLVLVDDVGAG
jgi:beta-phosphoglucomutase-like phosphatase (HAD superfamily)